MENSVIPELTFGMRIRMVRHQFRLSAEALGKITGHSNVAVRNWERGGEPKNQAEIVAKICAATGVDRDWLMWGENKKEPAKTGSELVAGAGLEPATSRLQQQYPLRFAA